MELLLTRDTKTELSTTGSLYIDGSFECYILEDTDRQLDAAMTLPQIQQLKRYGLTAIPTGRYRIVITWSNRFNRLLPQLLEVTGFAGIRIHPGNSAADTEGCLLPGLLRRANWVEHSRLAFNRLYDKIQTAINRQEPVFITIQ